MLYVVPLFHGTRTAKGGSMIQIHTPLNPPAGYTQACTGVERRAHASVESLTLAPREDGKIVTGYKTTAFNSLYGPNGVENVIWADYFEKIDAICG